MLLELGQEQSGCHVGCHPRNKSNRSRFFKKLHACFTVTSPTFPFLCNFKPLFRISEMLDKGKKFIQTKFRPWVSLVRSPIYTTLEGKALQFGRIVDTALVSGSGQQLWPFSPALAGVSSATNSVFDGPDCGNQDLGQMFPKWDIPTPQPGQLVPVAQGNGKSSAMIAVLMDKRVFSYSPWQQQPTRRCGDPIPPTTSFYATFPLLF